MKALIKKTAKPRVNTITGLKISLRMGLMKIFKKVKIPATMKKLLRPGII
jgi:hypothetical protein